MRLLLKIFALPLVLCLTLVWAVLVFLFSLSSVFLSLASVLISLLGIGLFFMGFPAGGVAYLAIGFLLSPLGLQAAADFLIDKLGDLNLSLRQFLTS